MAEKIPAFSRALYSIVVLVVVGGWGVGSLVAQTPDADIVIDGNDVGREYHGAGAISAGANARLLIDYPEPQRSQILDYLYKPGYGASLQILKVELGGGSNTTAGSDPSHMPAPDEVDCHRGYQWWLMKEARKRNPDIILYGQQWAAPGWLEDIWSQANIDYNLSWLRCAEEHGLTIDYIGGWNEKGFDADWFVAFEEALAEHYPDIKIPAADEIYQNPETWAVAESMAEHPAFKDAVDMIAMHWPCRWRTEYRDCPSNDLARGFGIPMQFTNAGMGLDVGAGPHVRALNRGYIDGKFASYLIWNTVEAWYANLPIGNSGIMQARWPWSGYYEVGKNIWAFAHTTQFTEPGWRYLDTGSARLENKASHAAYVAPSGEDYSLVIETMDMLRPDTLQIQVNSLPNRALNLWVTDLSSIDSDDHFRSEGTIVPSDGRFRLVVRPNHVYSITSTSGQGKGAAAPSATAHEQLPLPYAENFEGAEEGRMAPLFTSLSAEFEVAPCEGGRSGKCYEQVLDRAPIVWNDLGKMDPTTMVGDPRWAGDYTLTAKVLLEGPGYVELIGRISGQRPWYSWLGGYHMRVGTDGWEIYTEDPASRSKETISSGSARIEVGRWHELALQMEGDQLTVIVDGRPIETVEASSQRTGNAALRVSKWNNAQIDDVEVVPTRPSPAFVPHDQVSAANVSSAQGFYMGWTYEAENAVDDRLETRWQTEEGPVPHSITLDLGKERRVQGLWLTPRFDKTNAMITAYRIDMSRDGETFETVDEGEWAATAGTKVAEWDEAVPARYVRLVATGYEGRYASASEIRVVEAEPVQ